jgi:putative flippase GtrA
MPKPKISNLKFIIFSLIGIFNTLFDIALYTVLRSAGQSVIVANLISASAALIGSYLLNSKLTFKTKRWTLSSFGLFIVVTLFGLWVLQTGAIYVISHLLKNVPERYWSDLGSAQRIAKIVVPKLLATAITFVWNYVWYNKVIFKSSSRNEQLIIALDDL